MIDEASDWSWLHRRTTGLFIGVDTGRVLLSDLQYGLKKLEQSRAEKARLLELAKKRDGVQAN